MVLSEQNGSGSYMSNKSVDLPCGLKISRIGFGLSRLHHVWLESDRCRLIEEAKSLGITHFDAARLYGDGIAEKALGKAVRRCRSEVTISTKFGLIPNEFVGALGSAARPIWLMRKVLRRMNLSRWPGRSFSAETMQRSLATSLRLLQTDYVDVLFLHEPLLCDLENNGKLVDGLVAAKKAGKIRHIGLAGADHVKIDQLFPGVFEIIQLPESHWDSPVRLPDITYSVLTAVKSSEQIKRLDGDFVRTRLIQALARRPNGGILISSNKSSHIREAVTVLEGV